MTEPTRYIHQQILSRKFAGNDRSRAQVERAVTLNLYENLPRTPAQLLRMELSLRLGWFITAKPGDQDQDGSGTPWTAGQPIPEWANLLCRGEMTTYPLDVAG